MSATIPMMRAANQTMRAWYSEDLKKHERLMNLLETYHKVHLEENDRYAEKLTWCLEYTQSKFRDIKHGDGMDWYFELEEDAVVFAMKWT